MFAVSSKGLLHVEPAHGVLHVPVDVVGTAAPHSSLGGGAIKGLWDTDIRANGHSD